MSLKFGISDTALKTSNSARKTESNTTMAKTTAFKPGKGLSNKEASKNTTKAPPKKRKFMDNSPAAQKKRSEAARKAWITRRINQRSRAERIIPIVIDSGPVKKSIYDLSAEKALKDLETLQEQKKKVFEELKKFEAKVRRLAAQEISLKQLIHSLETITGRSYLSEEKQTVSTKPSVKIRKKRKSKKLSAPQYILQYIEKNGPSKVSDIIKSSSAHKVGALRKGIQVLIKKNQITKVRYGVYGLTQDSPNPFL